MKVVTYTVFSFVLLLLSACGMSTGGEDGVIGTGLKPDAHIKITGTVQKGPYLTNSEVLLNQLKADGSPSANTVLTYIDDDMGKFRFSVGQEGPVLITADGYHFNEISGEISRGRLLLKAVYYIGGREEQSLFVNILTHIAHKRVLDLVKQGSSVQQALTEAEQDVIRLLQPVLPITQLNNFSQYGVYAEGENARGSAYVLALSAVIYQYVMTSANANGNASIEQLLSRLLSELADRVSTNDDLDSQLLEELKQASRHVRPDLVKQNLENYSAEISSKVLTVADMDLFLDTDGDGELNVDDDDDDNDGIPDELDALPYVSG